MQRNISSILFIFLLAPGCRETLAAGLELAVSGAGSRTVKATDFVTVAFLVSNNTGVDDEITFAAGGDPDVAPLSVPKPATLTAGSQKKIPVTYSVSAGAAPGARMRAALTAAGARSGATAEAEAVFTVEEKICAEFAGAPATLYAAGGESAALEVTISNCGSARDTFTLAAAADADVAIGGATAAATLSPGEKKPMSLSITPAVKNDDYRSELKLRIMRGEIVLDEHAVSIYARRIEAAAGGENRRFITLKLGLEYALTSGLSPKTLLKVSLPPFSDSGLTLKSDSWMENGGGKLETRRQRHEMYIGGARIVVGDQRFPMKHFLAPDRDYEGRLLAAPAGGGEAFAFIGGAGAEELRHIGWRRGFGGGLTVGLARIGRKNYSGGGARMSGDVLTADYSAGKWLNAALELAATRQSAAPGAPEKSGRGFKLSGSYDRPGRARLRAALQGGGDYFASWGRQRGRELSAEKQWGKNSRLLLSTRKFDSFRPCALKDSCAAPVLYEYSDAAMGWSLRPRGAKLSFYAGLNTRDYDKYNPAAPGAPENVAERTVSVKVDWRAGALALTAGFEAGRETTGGGARDFREYEFSADYNKKGFSLGAGLSRSLDFQESDGFPADGRTLRAAAGYVFPGNKISFRAGWRKETGAGGGDGASRRTEFMLDARISSRDALGLRYGIAGGGDGKRSFTASYSRNLDVKIPYRKNGALSGRAFVDYNANGVMDGDDRPLAGVGVSVGNKFKTVTAADGAYVIRGIQPGKYDLRIEGESFPVGMSPASAGALRAKVKSGGESRFDIAFNELSSIGGRVSVDESNYFARFRKIKPSQLRIVLFDKGRAAAETFTAADGNYYFENLAPGVYEVAMDASWLPEGAAVESAGRWYVVCGRGGTAAYTADRKTPPLAGAADFEAARGAEPAAGYITSPVFSNGKKSAAGAAPSARSDADFTIGLKSKTLVKTFKK